MRTISPANDVQRLKEVLATLGRRRSLRDPMAAACDELDLTAPQIHALMWLRLDGPLTMGEIARRIHSSDKSITGIIDRLERRSLLQRDRDGKDRRVIRCRLTRAGARVADKLDGAMTHAMELFLSLLDAGERHQLIVILESLAHRMERAAA